MTVLPESHARTDASGARSHIAAVDSGRPSRREWLVAWGLLALVGVVAYAQSILNSGFSTDDWANAATTIYNADGFGGVIASFADLTKYRPVLILYVPLTYEVLGTHMGFHLAWAALLAVLVSCLVHGILRRLGVRPVHAWMIAALVLIYPWFDSTRLWATASMASLAIAFALAGIWMSLIGLERRSWRWHAGAIALYLLSGLTYELTLPLIGAAGLLYVACAGWRAARWRWAADLVTVMAIAAWNVSTTRRTTAFGLDASFTHARQIAREGLTLLGRTALPVGPPRTWVAVAVLGALAVLALVLRRRVDGLRPWLWLFAGGLVTAALGWIMFIPADPYYTPSVYGFTNRVNALAGIGLVIAVYAAAGIVGTLAGRLAPGTRRAGAAVTVALGLVLGVAYAGVLDRHSQLWEDAFSAQLGALGQMKTHLPELADGSTVYMYGYPAYLAPGVPIFAVSWDLNNAIKIQYRQGDLAGYPVVAGATVRCDRAGVVIRGPGFEGTPPAPFGKAILFDVPSGRTVKPADVASCRRGLRGFAPGPTQLHGDY
jgi:hypothetical protein